MPAVMESVAILQSIDPATGEIVGEVPLTPVDEIRVVVDRAHAAQKAWSRLPLSQRAELIKPLSEKLLARADELALLITREMGKPLKDALGEVRAYAGTLPSMLEEIITALQPEILEDENTKSIIYREPFGVCAAITPWNFPLGMPFEAIVPALMAGNAVILKPSEETPLIGQALADILNQTLPPGVLQVVHGTDEQGKALVAAEGVELIAFTGSREAGKHILSAASKGLKRVILELGGKDPMIVLDDADIEAAAKFAVRNSFRNCGQVCVSTERIYVDSRVADQFEQRVAELASALKIGPGTQEGNDLGPMVNNRQKQWVLKQVAKAKQQGARVVLDGARESSAEGNFVKPTVLANVDHTMDIMREETFGPVACIARFNTVEEAIDLANDTPYGLGATVFGRDEQRAADVARHLEAGMIGVNKSCGGASGAPWVGAKQSGYGWHSGKDGHRQFTQPRVVSLPKSRADTRV
ncbi:MAG: aldehyde dehydrogenase family protein [Phycisphaerales bacterium]|nr:aldehyde dehydrogenase family protein [Phycisphaerales bacterium]MCI0631286.1 aldehyde dehydrogenase family protein [Phycisphaerales bacterium]MCI0676357.1 aldehyde dehydrogenase family protein [Phycisphaerales bacterium]